MKLALASDHAGYPLKQELLKYLRNEGHEVHDLGVDTDKVPSDYPDAAQALGTAILDGRALSRIRLGEYFTRSRK